MPSNGVVEDDLPIAAMTSRPTLLESTRASPELPCGSSQAPAANPSVRPQVPPVASSSSRNAIYNFAPNHTMQPRQRSLKRNGGSGGGNSGGRNVHCNFFCHPLQAAPYPSNPRVPNCFGSMLPVGTPFPGEPSYWNHAWDVNPISDFMPQVHPINDYRNSYNGRSFGAVPLGNDQYRNNHGGKRDQNHRGYYHPEDACMHQQRAPPFRPPSSPNLYIDPRLSAPLATPVAPEFGSHPPMERYRYLPIMYPPAIHFGVRNPALAKTLVNQIEYYFSNENLAKDAFLRSKMDFQGWVSIDLIATFPRVKSMTKDIPFIVESLKSSTFLEVRDRKVRKRSEWRKWIPSYIWESSNSASVTPGGSSGEALEDSASVSPDVSSPRTLETSFQRITIDEVCTGKNTTDQGEPSSDALPHSIVSVGPLQLSPGEATENAKSPRVV